MYTEAPAFLTHASIDGDVDQETGDIGIVVIVSPCMLSVTKSRCAIAKIKVEEIDLEKVEQALNSSGREYKVHNDILVINFGYNTVADIMTELVRLFPQKSFEDPHYWFSLASNADEDSPPDLYLIDIDQEHRVIDILLVAQRPEDMSQVARYGSSRLNEYAEKLRATGLCRDVQLQVMEGGAAAQTYLSVTLEENAGEAFEATLHALVRAFPVS